jgi:hypothetical protein
LAAAASGAGAALAGGAAGFCAWAEPAPASSVTAASAAVVREVEDLMPGQSGPLGALIRRHGLRVASAGAYAKRLVLERWEVCDSER